MKRLFLAAVFALWATGANTQLPPNQGGMVPNAAVSLIALANGGTGADLSATGGASQFLKQASAGAAITVVRPTCGDLSNSGSACQAAVGTTGATVPVNNGANQFSADRLQIGGNGATLITGETSLAKIGASGSAPGAGFLKFEATVGTNAGTCKIIAYAGTSTTPVTIVDNVGTGC